MYFDKIVITAKGAETHFSYSTNNERVDVHILSTEKFKQVLKDVKIDTWVGNENYSQKVSLNVTTIRIKISDSNFVYYKIRINDYNKAINSFLAQVGGL